MSGTKQTKQTNRENRAKNGLRLALCGLLCAAIALAGFAAPEYLGRRWAAEEAKPYTVDAASVSFTPANDDVVTLLQMLGDEEETIDWGELERGYVYDAAEAEAHARTLLTDFLMMMGFYTTAELLGSDAVTPASLVCELILRVEEDGAAHSAAVWDVSYQLESDDDAFEVLFDDAS
ncbi:MAG: hypothetical protein IJ751_09070, partial [Oscillospiraceae bacterium]|nr:hypothetical protein [Oscillospiraceae bacterium]